eukprot:TRINITY_DN10107_c0_g1_i1.p1 TRINITY_DN10107_c0_g1~~TRINITY_DN10107_c0_g1_i1.p1  ORF type:complete len:346 (-),score=129.69 TRINITY_DN10107_c0_g1_i1:195-1232(-)
MSDNEAGETRSKKNMYRKDKPWDTEDIDKWKIQEFKQGDMKSHLLEESSFAVLFPQYREKYLRECWPIVTKELKTCGIDCELDCIEGSMSVRTTRKTFDPYAIINARDLIKLLARSIPVEQALKILNDDMQCDIIKIGGQVRNKDKFLRRRQRLVGKNGSTLKAIEMLTGCYMLVQGNTVAVMGTFKGLKQVRRIVLDCMNNIHPIYKIQELMVRRELEKDPELKNENWDRFLPKFKKKNVQSKAPVQTKKKKAKYTPFPAANHQLPSKLDQQLASGEYFLNEADRLAKKQAEKNLKTEKALKSKKEKKNAQFIAPKETSRKRKRTEIVADTEDISDLVSKFKKQ